MAGTTPSQTIGPFFGVMRPLGSNQLIDPRAAGAITIRGRVLDGDGAPVVDAVIEAWQADATGRYAHPDDPRFTSEADPPGFRGWGRCATGADGRFSFVTVRPGRVAGVDERPQAPHINISVFARGLLKRLATRVYFADEERANAIDPLLAAITEPEVRETLLAQPDGPRAYRFDIRLRGEGETAFLEF
jgi:protocatechuate 3,4-dioxygenase alpha subunit